MIHQSDYVQGGVPLINPSHMIEDKIHPNEDVTVSKAMAKILDAYMIYDGDIVMARRGEVGRIALVTLHENGWLCGTGSFVLRFSSEIPRDYLRVFFRSNYSRTYLSGEAIGTTMVNLNHGILKKMPIGLPPIAEQHRIVAKVDELMEICDQLKTRITTANQLQQKLADVLVGRAVA
jgi:type I restriction enzyme S subunit